MIKVNWDCCLSALERRFDEELTMTLSYLQLILNLVDANIHYMHHSYNTVPTYARTYNIS